jgi:hypothetical protein
MDPPISVRQDAHSANPEPQMPEPDDKAQSKWFSDPARKVGADRDSTERGDALTGELAKQPPERRKPKK